MEVKVGMRFTYRFADGRPVWEVKEEVDENEFLCEILEDQDGEGRKQIFSRSQIEGELAWQAFLSEKRKK